MNFILLAFVLALLCFTATAETVEYGYDACGNRISRQIVLRGNKSLSTTDTQEDFSEEQLGAVQVKISPNPTYGQLKVALQGEEEIRGTIEVYNIQGRKVAQVQSVEASNMIDISAEPSGIYLMKLRVNDENSTWKIIKK